LARIPAPGDAGQFFPTAGFLNLRTGSLFLGATIDETEPESIANRIGR
jgi:hypothetical protein